MSASAGGPVVAVVMAPFLIDTASLDGPPATGLRPLEVRVVEYVDSQPLRIAKASGAPDDEVTAGEPLLDGASRSALADAEVVVGLDVPLALPALAPRLRWVQGLGAGVGQLVRVVAGSGAILTSASGVAAPSMAEFVMARLLQVWKHLRLLDSQQQEHRWRARYGTTVAGLTLGIVGLGAIGREVARRAAAFDMKVIGIRRHPGKPPPGVSEVMGPDDLGHLLERSDAVVVAAPATAETKDLIGAAELARMRPGAVLCNVARGSLVDEDAVVEALRSGHLGAAILDVTRQEPLDPQSPLWEEAGVYLSPHSSVSLDRYRDRLTDLVAANLRRYRGGEPLVNVVDLELGY